MSISGYKELSDRLQALGAVGGGNVLRTSARHAMTPAIEAARAAAPEADPPYGPYAGRTSSVDPYPKKTYKGRRVAPGFTKRSIAVRAFLAKTRNYVKVSLGVAKEAFYAVQFIELGTSKIPKRPWLEPSFSAAASKVDRALRDVLRKRLDAAAKRGRKAIERELSRPL